MARKKKEAEKPEAEEVEEQKPKPEPMTVLLAPQPGKMPPHGLPPTDARGRALEPDAVFVERDGKEYAARIEREYEYPVAFPIDGTADHRAETRKAYDCRVCFTSKDHKDWKPVTGVVDEEYAGRGRRRRFLRKLSKSEDKE